MATRSFVNENPKNLIRPSRDLNQIINNSVEITPPETMLALRHTS
jgi:hypothetical protein